MSGQLFTINNFAGLPVFVLKFSEHFPSEPGRKQINHERDPNKNSGKNMVSWKITLVLRKMFFCYFNYKFLHIKQITKIGVIASHHRKIILAISGISHTITLKVHFLREAHSSSVTSVIIISHIPAPVISGGPDSSVVVHRAAIWVIPTPQICRFDDASHEVGG